MMKGIRRSILSHVIMTIQGASRSICFDKAYPAETAEAFCDDRVAAFALFGGVPQSILYDNTKLAVAKIVKSGRRLRSQMFAELQSHYLFDDRLGDRERETTRARWKGSSVTPGAIS